MALSSLLLLQVSGLPLFPLNANPKISYSVSPPVLTATAGSLSGSTVVTTTDSDTYQRQLTITPPTFEEVVIPSTYHSAAPLATPPLGEAFSYISFTFTQSSYSSGTYTYSHVKRIRTKCPNNDPITSPALFIDRYVASDNASQQFIAVRDFNAQSGNYAFAFAQSVIVNPPTP